jgi:hypothetical protein
MQLRCAILASEHAMPVHSLNKSPNRSPGLWSRLNLRPGRALGVLFAAAAIACGGDSTTSPESIEGVYTLQTIDGDALPAVVYQDTEGQVEVTAGAITLGPGTKWSISLTARATLAAEVSTNTETLDGTWSRAGSTLTLTSADGDVETLVLSVRTLTLQAEAGAGVVPWVFRR